MKHSNSGFALVATLIMLSALLALLGAYFRISTIELASTRFTSDSVRGFYTAEAGLNLRAEQIKQVFIGYNRPSGTSPSSTSPCEGGDNGAGDFACQEFLLGNHRTVTYVVESPNNPVSKTIPQGERYQGLNAQEYEYTVRSIAYGPKDQVEAILELVFRSRLVPMFQFVAFYNKDLEILPGPAMTLNGPIHTNGDLYLNANNSLAISGQVTTAEDLYRGRKNDSSCNSVTVSVLDPINPQSIYPSCSSRVQVTESYLTPWNDMVQVDVPVVTVPEPEALNPTPGEAYFDNADLRLALRLTATNVPDTTNSPTGVEVRAADNTVDAVLTAALHDSVNCPSSLLSSGVPVDATDSFYNNREGEFIEMLEVDLEALFGCIHQNSLFGAGVTLADDTEGGIVFHFTVDGPDSFGINRYGVRLRNAAEFAAPSALGAPSVRGMTMVTDQAAYTMGHYNSVNKKPAAILADSFNVLSQAWNNDANSTSSLSSRNAQSTTVNVAVLAGTDSTGNTEGSGGQDSGNYNGGLENYPRLHESWSGDTLTYRGSFVSLNTPNRVNGSWVYGNPQYQAPGRDWDFDTDFNDAANLPPMSPRFVYLRQELFVRQFEQ